MDEAQKAIEEAERAGFDLSLVDSNLALSYEERVLRHDGALELAQMLRAAGAAMYAQTSSAAAASR